MKPRTPIVISILAGGGDLATGVLLIAAPREVLKLLHLPAMHDLVLMRFIGCFVGTVGLSYFAGLAAWAWTGSSVRLRVVWELTILFRVIVGGFVATEVALGQLPMAWVMVPVTDWGWAALQAVLLRLGIFQETAR